MIVNNLFFGEDTFISQTERNFNFKGGDFFEFWIDVLFRVSNS